MITMRGAFEFVDDGRTYTCRVEESRGARPEGWWWSSVAGDPNRYAPFRAAVGDSDASVRARVVPYYENLLARRGWRWQDREPIPTRG